MKYMQNGGFQSHPLMRLTLGLTLVFLAGLWVTMILMYTAKMGFTPQSVRDYYLGSEAAFTQPRTYQSMLEVAHFHLPMIAIVVLLLTHLLIFAPFSTAFKVGFIVVAFASGFLNEGAGWLVRFVDPGFAAVKVGSFLIFQGTLLFLIVALAWFLFAPAKPKRSRTRV